MKDNMKALIKIPLIFLTFLLPFSGDLVYSSSKLDQLEEGFDPQEIINILEDGYSRVFDYTAVFLKQEYIEGKLLPLETIEFKFRKPGDIYMKWLTSPYKGQEALYRNNGNNITVHKGGILGMVTVNVDPKGALAMKNRHHPIYDAGIGSTIALVKRGLQSGIKKGEFSIVYKGEVFFEGRKTVALEAEFPKKCEGIMHIVEKGEDLWNIAEKYNQDMYVIMHNNKDIEEPKGLNKGLEILVPYHYCQRIVVYIDKKSALLVKLEIFDWKGNLYETYQYKNLKINVGLTENDFNPDNAQYNF